MFCLMPRNREIRFKSGVFFVYSYYYYYARQYMHTYILFRVFVCYVYPYAEKLPKTLRKRKWQQTTAV